MGIIAMKLGAATRLPSKKVLPILLSVSLFLVTASTPLFLHEVQAASSVPWDADAFRKLEAMSGDLVTFVQGLEHPNSGKYGKLSPTRQAKFNLFLDALFTAIKASLADGATGNWCGVKTKAVDAGYAITRFYDTDSGRWFVYAYDTTQFGQAYIFINPFAKRNLVIEVPHEDFEAGTKTQGAHLFKARATVERPMSAVATSVNPMSRITRRTPFICCTYDTPTWTR
jgi:hypothetical protein